MLLLLTNDSESTCMKVSMGGFVHDCAALIAEGIKMMDAKKNAYFKYGEKY